MTEHMFSNKSLWFDTLASPITPNPTCVGDHTFDVAICGGGFTGLSAALHIKKLKPELSVAVLESHVCGYGASGRNGGFAMTLFGLTKPMLNGFYGDTKTHAAHLYMEDAVDFLVDLIKENNIDCDFEQSGYLLASMSKGQSKRLHADFKIAQKLGWEGIEHWDKKRLDEEFSFNPYVEGWYEPRCAILHPAKLARGLKDLAESIGVKIFENSPVQEFRKNKEASFEVSTPQGKIVSEKLVLALNAYSILFPQLNAKQYPVFSYIVATDPLTEEQLSTIGWKSRTGVEDPKNLIHYYRLTKDNRIVMGGGDCSLPLGKNLNLDENEKFFEQLKNYVHQIFPSLKNIRFSHQWGGPVSITADFAPAIGYLGKDKNAIYALGCTGHGVSLTPYNGLTIAEMVTGRESKRTEQWFVGRRVLPWPPEPIRFIATHMVKSYLKVEDRLFYRGLQ